MFTKSSATPPRLVEKQLRNWEFARTQHPDLPIRLPHRVHQFIAISRSLGSGGLDVAEALGKRLGWPVFDRQLLQNMAGDDLQKSGVYRSLDERDPGLLEETFRSLLDTDFHKNDYFHRLRQTVWAAARQSPAIFVGRGVDMILPRDCGLRVRIFASRAVCVDRVATRFGLTRELAATEIDRLERERTTWIRNHFHTDPAEETRYDLSINLERFTIEQAVRVILTAMTERTGTAAP